MNDAFLALKGDSHPEKVFDVTLPPARWLTTTVKITALMTMLLVLAGVGVVVAVTTAGAQQIDVRAAASRDVVRGGEANFTGTALIEMLFSPSEESRAGGAQVTFTPGARTTWHSHPAGQTLIVTSGSGWVQAWNDAKRRISAGDVVWTPPGVKHWHGATPSTTLSHIAIQETVGGKNVEWMEPVTESQYGR